MIEVLPKTREFITSLFRAEKPVLEEKEELITIQKPLTRDERLSVYKQETRPLAIATNITALAAKLAKVDGPANTDEINRFSQIFPLPKLNIDYTMLFLKACEEQVDFSIYFRRMQNYVSQDPKFFEQLLSTMFEFAACDRPITLSEILFLNEVVVNFNIDREIFVKKLKEYIVPKGQPFSILNVLPKTDISELKKAYTEAIQRYDLKTIEGFASIPELAQIVNERMEVINNAYKHLKLFSK